MTTEELIPGEYYHMWFNKENEWILQFKEIKNGSICIISGIRLNNKVFYHDYNWGTAKSAMEIQPTSNEEILWLQACVEIKKFIPKPEIIENYAIF